MFVNNEQNISYIVLQGFYKYNLLTECSGLVIINKW